MARFPRLDPAHPKGIVLSTKLPVPYAERLARQARQEGMSRSAYLRNMVLDALGRADSQPPEKAA